MDNKIKNFNTFGVMLDFSRNAVMNVENLKKFISTIASMGYNMVMLYTEDTYEVEGHPLFGHRRGRMTVDEIKDIDAYCRNLNIELVPCIQTLAHLYCLLKWMDYRDTVRDCDDILLAEEPKTYELIEDMFRTISKCFTSKRIHIGMDEADKVGLGKYLEKHGYQNRFEIINKHLFKVCDLAKKYDLEPMVWSDMFCRLGFNTENQYDIPSEIKKPDIDMPDNVSLVYWDYYNTEYDHYSKMIDLNKVFEKNTLFAGGIWTWKGFAPDNGFSFKCGEPAIRACIDKGIKDVFFTMWGDDGAECSRYSVLPALMYNAEIARGNYDIESIKEKFKKLVGCDFDSFMKLDKLDLPGDQHEGNPSKYLLYNDPFLGLADNLCNGSEDKYYEKLGEEIKKVKPSGEYGYVFDTLIDLCNVLAVKSDLGLRTRELYTKGDKQGLKKLAENEYMQAAERLSVLHESFEKQWLIENKPYGFEVQDLRIGGLIQRLKSCSKRLVQYADGITDSIPELEEIPVYGKIEFLQPGIWWSKIVTPGVITHML